MSPPPALTEDEEVSGCSEECESVRRRTCLSYSCIQTRWILFPPLPQSVFPLCFVCMLKPGRREQQESVSLHRRRALCWEVSARRSSRDTAAPSAVKERNAIGAVCVLILRTQIGNLSQHTLPLYSAPDSGY